MYLDNIQICNVRVITQAKLSFSSHVNLITGANGSGKSSLLESIYLLGVGRSFRTNQIKTVINENENDLTVFGKLSEPGRESLGIRRDSQGKFTVKINGIEQNKLSSLAHYLPVLVITPDSYKLLTAGPQFRRQFLDLSVFHVEHSFSSNWQRYNRLLKQRNAQLKSARSYKDLTIWDKEYTDLALSINISRNKEFLLLKSHLEAIQSIFLPQYRVQYHYQAGWVCEASESLEDQLKAVFDTDRRYGYSTLGAHKADLKLTIDNQPVHEVLSRGEQKLLVNAMHLAQAKRLSEDVGKHCALLIDDLPSELDQQKQKLLLQELSKLSKVQLFITAINKINIQSKEYEAIKNAKVFHVEQGCVSEYTNDLT